MICQHCGKTVGSETRFCAYCGANIGSLPTQSVTRSSDSQRRRLVANRVLRNILRIGVLVTMFSLSYMLTEWAAELLSSDLNADTINLWFFIFAMLGVIVLLLSFASASPLWGFFFALGFSAGYAGLLPHPEVSVGSVLIVAIPGGVMLGGLCAALAHLGRRVSARSRAAVVCTVLVVIAIAVLFRSDVREISDHLPTPSAHRAQSSVDHDLQGFGGSSR